MKTYTIRKAGSDINWDNADMLEISNALWLEDAGIKAYGQIMWDTTGLYVHLWAKEKNIRAEHQGPLSMVCEDSCLEFFFQPVEYDARYFNFEVNPNAAFYVGFQIDRLNAVRLKPGDNDEDLKAVASRTEDGWDIKYKVPVELIQLMFPGYGLQSGMVLKANCFKCGDKTAQRHYYAWNDTWFEEPDFHKHEHFGKMILE